MKITILDDYQHEIEKLACFQLLKGQHVEILHYTEKDPYKLAELLKETEIIVLTRERTAINDQLLTLLPNLKFISQTGKISNHLDLAACTRHAVAVAEGLGSPIAPAELTWALIMNVVRKIPQAIKGMKDGKWQINIGSKIEGKIIGIWGYGKIGQRIAHYAKAFGADVMVWGSQNSRNKAVQDGFTSASSKDEFFCKADIVTLHLRLVEETRGIVREADLRRMKENAVLINTARAELLEKDALYNTLQDRKDLLVGLDVYEEEPIYDTKYKFLNMDNVICTPHIGYVEKDGYELYFGKAFENVINYIKDTPSNIANPAALQRQK